MTRRLLAPLLAGSLAGSALAQQPAPTPTPATPPPAASGEAADEKPERTYGETVVVTASKTAEELRDAPVAVTVVSAPEIAASAGEGYGDLLRPVPGLNVAQTSARDVNLTPRLATGRNARATLALLDGRTIYQDYFGMVLWDLLPINFDEVKQVEVVRGPDSAMWGPNAFGGVVNILTKDPAEMLGTSVKVGGGTLGTREAGVIHAGTSGAASYKVSGSYFTQDAWERPTTLPDGTPLPPYENTGTHQYRLDLRLDLDRPDAGKWKFGAGFASSDGAMLTGLGPFDSKDLYQGHVSAGYRKGDFHAAGEATLHDAKYVGFLTPDVVTMKNQAVAAEAGDRHLFGEKNLVTWGASARYSHFDLSLVPDVHARTDLAVFAEDEIFLAETLRLRIGARYDWSDTYGGAVSPRTGLIFEPHKDHTFRLSWNRAFIAPSLVEDFLYFPSSAFATLPTGPYVFPILATGSSSLDAETMNAFEIGYTGTLAGRVTVTASAYYNISRDRIFFVPIESYTSADPPPGWPLPPSALDQIGLPKTFSYRNLGRIVDRGFEFSADAKLTRALTAFANYSWQADPDVSEQGAATIPVNLPARHRVNAGLGVAAGPFSGSVSVNYTASAFWTDVQPYVGTTAPFTLWNAALGWTFRNGLAVAVRAVNLADARVQQHVFGDILRRRVTGELRFHF
ncbi:MAG TPA: TonB-dependent receptor [Thermoanaerobaculia bacterium]|nr:TonB-dependent receptor [Thermoanaerobaculia bacterium]